MEDTTTTTEEEEESKAEAPPVIALSEDATKSLLDLLLKRGYLHDGVDASLADPERGDPNLDHATTTSPNAILSPEDATCQVVLLQQKQQQGEKEETISSSSYCCTYSVLEQKLRNELQMSNGRCAIKQLVQSLRLRNDKPIIRTLEQQQQQCNSTNVLQQGDELITSTYLDGAIQEIFDSVLAAASTAPAEGGGGGGFQLVSDLASQRLHLPMNLTLESLKERLPNEGDLQILKLEQGETLVSNDYLDTLQQHVLKSFSDLMEPVTISDICQSRDWDVGLVTSWVQEACQKEQLSGDFHGGSNAAKGSELYTPHAHEEAKRQAVDEIFAAQGYMTATKGAALGLSKSKMAEYIQQSFPSVVIVSESLVVATDTILSPLEAVVQEAIAMNSFVDLAEHIPADILERVEDAKLILKKHVLPALAEEAEEDNARTKKKKKKKNSKAEPSSLGVTVLSAASGGLFVSEGMIKDFQQKVLLGLITDYAKERAKELDAAEVAGESSTTTSSSKSKASSAAKKKGRKGKKAAIQEGENEGQSEDVVPLITVVKSLGSEHPELIDTDAILKETLDGAGDGGDVSALPKLTWERRNDSSQEGDVASTICNDGLICELCRSALYNEKFVASCQRSIELELKSLQSARLSKASVSRKDAATKVRNVQTAFEEAFVDACNLLQAQFKFVEYVENDDSNKELVEKLKSEFLQGCCAEFTSRVTQYCLFKNEIDSALFRFVLGNDDSPSSEPNEEEEEAETTQGATQPPYCVSPDLAMRQYPRTFLTLNDSVDADGQSKVKDPLPKLREVLPGNIGVALARQWVMCGGACYQGGTKVDESGNAFTRPGDLEKFMAHVEENCLSLCGLPFKKLDKKSEKQFLFARRQRLLRMLEEAPNDDATTILDLTILLLFQQVRNVVAFGSSLYPDILKLLTAERKIDDEVAGALTGLSEGLESAVDIALIDTVRQCGLSRDISKHKII